MLNQTTLEQPQLRFAQLGTQTRDRWQKLLTSHRTDLSERMRKLLTIALEACEAHAPTILQARWHGGAIWLCCQQIHIGNLLGCSDRTVRDELATLKTLGCLLTHQHPTRENFIGYRFDLAALETLEQSHTPDLDDIILDWHSQQGNEPTETTTNNATAEPVAVSVSAPVSAGSSGPPSGGSSGHFSAGSSGLMNHDHEGLNINNINSITHDHDSPDARERDPARPARFDAIDETDLRGIAGFAVTIAGRTGVAGPASRLRKLREYFADAVQASLADSGEFPAFAALFRHVGRRVDVKHRPRYLRTLWTNRDTKPLDAILTPADREYVRRLLDDAAQAEPAGRSVPAIRSPAAVLT